MNEVTELLGRMEAGDATAAARLLPLVYRALRDLAAQKLAQERPGQTLEATALVHEAYLRLVEGDPTRHWSSRGHFFSAAAESMRRILIEQARRKQALKRGGGGVREDLSQLAIRAPQADVELLALNEALDKLAAVDRQAVELVNLRFFAGLSGREAADVMGISPRSADRLWAYARSYLFTLNPEADAEGEAPPPADRGGGSSAG